MWRVSGELPENILIMLYNSFINSRLSFGIETWCGAPSSLTNKLNVLQKRAIRLVKGGDRLF